MRHVHLDAETLGPARQLDPGWDERIVTAVTRYNADIGHFLATLESVL